MYEQQIENFISNSELALLRQNSSQQDVLQKLALKAAGIKRVKGMKKISTTFIVFVSEQQATFQTTMPSKLPTIQETEQKPHHLDELLINYQPSVFANSQMKNEDAKTEREL